MAARPLRPPASFAGISDAAAGSLTGWARLAEREDRLLTMLINAEPGPLGAPRSACPVNDGITRRSWHALRLEVLTGLSHPRRGSLWVVCGVGVPEVRRCAATQAVAGRGSPCPQHRRRSLSLTLIITSHTSTGRRAGEESGGDVYGRTHE